MSPFEDTTEQERYDALVAEGKTPEEAHNQVVAEREAVTGSGEPDNTDATEPDATDSEQEPEPDATTEDDPGSDAEQAEPSTEYARDPDAFDTDPQSKVASSHDYTGEKGNPSVGERPDAEVGTEDQPLAADRRADEIEELPQATVPPSARTQPRA